MSESAPNYTPSDDPKIEHELQDGLSLYDSMRLFQEGKEQAEHYFEGAPITNEIINEGDILVMEASSELGQEQGCTFIVRDTHWHNLGLTGAGPSKSLLGNIDGLFIPENLKGEQVSLIGSGIGGASVIPGVICRGKQVYFGSAHEEFHTAPITDCGILIKAPSGEYRYFNHQSESRPDISPEAKEADKCNRELVDSLFQSLPFIQQYLTAEEFLSGKVPETKYFTYDDEDYAVKFDYHPESGAELAIISKKKQKIVFCKYYSPDDEHLLQISEVNIRDNLSLLSFIESIDDLRTDTIHIAGASCVSYNTSSTLGIHEVTYQPSNDEAVQDIGIDPKDLGIGSEDPRLQTSAPAIQLWQDGSVKLDFGTTLRRKIKENPEFGKLISKNISAAWSLERGHIFRVGEKFITVRRPQEILGEV